MLPGTHIALVGATSQLALVLPCSVRLRASMGAVGAHVGLHDPWFEVSHHALECGRLEYQIKWPQVHNTGHSAGVCEMTVSAGAQGRKRIASDLKLHRPGRTRQVKIWTALLLAPALRIDTDPRAQRRQRTSEAIWSTSKGKWPCSATAY